MSPLNPAGAHSSPRQFCNELGMQSGTRRQGRALPFLLLALIVFLCGLTTAAHASHFRYGHYTWKSLGANVIEFTVQNALRRDGFACKTPASGATVPCSGVDGLPGVGDVILETIGSTQFNFGDGGPPTPILYYRVTSVDPAANWMFAIALDPANPARTTITHTYPAAGNYLAFTSSCCRISGLDAPNAHINNPDGGYRVETLVNIGSGNSPPSSTLPPVVVCSINDLCQFYIPAGDANGDRIRFRFSTGAEASSFAPLAQPGPPYALHAPTIDSFGLYSWDTTGATLGPAGLNTLYSTQITIEDLDPAGNVKSKTAVDFLIQLVPKIGSPPVLNLPPIVTCPGTLSVVAGQTLTIPIAAADPDVGQTVQLNVVGLPAGATMTPALPVIGNPVSSKLTWKPSLDQLGTTVITFTGRDSTGRQSLCSQTIAVVHDAVATSSGTNFDGSEINEGTFLWFTVSFDPKDVPKKASSRIFFENASIQFAANGKSHVLRLPDSVINFSVDATCSSATFGVTGWRVTVPSGEKDDILLSALSSRVPVGGLPGGIKNVTMSGTLRADTPGIDIKWQWRVAAYSAFPADYNQVLVKTTKKDACIGFKHDDVGTPEGVIGGVPIKNFLVNGPRGGAGSNYTGGASKSTKVKSLPN